MAPLLSDELAVGVERIRADVDAFTSAVYGEDDAAAEAAISKLTIKVVVARLFLDARRRAREKAGAR